MAICVAMVGVASPAFAQASLFDDYEAPSGSVSGVQVTIDGTDQTDTDSDASEVERLVAPVGVAECQELKTEADGQPDIFFVWSGASPSNVDDQRLREFEVERQDEPVCRRGDNQDQSGCTRISEGESDSITVTQSGAGPPMQVGFTFPALMRYRDDTVEECAFRGSGAGTQQMSDAGMTDSGLVSDAGTGDTAGESGDLPDILYNARLFLGGGGGSGNVVPVDAALYLDRTRPPQPEVMSVEATQNQIQYEVRRPSDRTNDVEAFWLFYSNDPIESGDPGEAFFDASGVQQQTVGDFTTDPDNAGEPFTDSTSVDLSPGESIYVGIVTRDKAENFSLVATTGEAVEVGEERGLSDVYAEAGGSERGGCGCASSNGLPFSMMATLFVLIGAGLLRRRFGVAGLLAAGVVILVAAPAGAQSDVNGNFELRFGPYYPSIDSEFGGDTQPFQDLFGGNNRVMGEIKIDSYVYDGHGKLGVGGTIGYTNFTGDAQVSSPGGGEAPNIDAKTKLQLLPLRAQVFYRWDYLQQRFDIPIVPRVEAGLDWFMWRIRDGSGNTATFGEGGPKAQGATAGYHGSAGLEVNLNPIDPKSAATFDYTWGVNRTYLFAIYEFAQVNDFGGEGFNLSDETWRLGLAFEF